MTPNTDEKNSNAWIAIDHGLGIDHRLALYILVLKGERSLYQTIKEDDWVLVLSPTGSITRVGVCCGFVPISRPRRSTSTDCCRPQNPSRLTSLHSRCRLREVSGESSGPISSKPC